ncbi:uncharacterized protein MELLADRAFT_102093 [Melampsora larici-populina 98AG31]|uniref:Uncharacterized protein n=1 Tax=Melampsora larici-populina (strain 98AG31 / pathotype 3-4-7) TaxID=747676 RepID=F4R5Z3_MELLP|nr:uncharacterized protein MELLADRAFT_102093 [Melampsora larici-populina 98AG31]EGG12125.1 hypothetical protein MELLADRAFT_102093 [Melampsora larici-populina 98AG31]
MIFVVCNKPTNLHKIKATMGTPRATNTNKIRVAVLAAMAADMWIHPVLISKMITRMSEPMESRTTRVVWMNPHTKGEGMVDRQVNLPRMTIKLCNCQSEYAGRSHQTQGCHDEYGRHNDGSYREAQHTAQYREVQQEHNGGNRSHYAEPMYQNPGMSYLVTINERAPVVAARVTLRAKVRRAAAYGIGRFNMDDSSCSRYDWYLMLAQYYHVTYLLRNAQMEPTVMTFLPDGKRKSCSLVSKHAMPSSPTMTWN